MAEERDPKLDAAYRALGAEAPPRALDDAILAASRRAVRVHPAPLVAPTGRRSWSVPLAAAAVIALAVGVTVHLQIEQPGIDGLPPAAPSAPASVASPDAARLEKKAPPAYAPPAAAKQALAKPAQDSVAASPAREKTEQPAAAGRVAENSSAQARSAAQEMRAAAPQELRSPAAQAAPAPAMAMAKRADAPAKDAAETPERELERIAELRKQAKHEEADKALAEFRKRYPDYKIPAPILERVERR